MKRWSKGTAAGRDGSYNKNNGTHCSENKETDILRKRWGYEGMVVTDQGAVEAPKGHRGTGSGNARRKRPRHKLDPSAIKAGTLSEEELNTAVRNLLRFWIL